MVHHIRSQVVIATIIDEVFGVLVEEVAERFPRTLLVVLPLQKELPLAIRRPPMGLDGLHKPFIRC